MAPAEYHSVKIRKATYDKLQNLIQKLAQDGWASIGSSRRDELTATNVIDEAITIATAKATTAPP